METTTFSRLAICAQRASEPETPRMNIVKFIVSILGAALASAAPVAAQSTTPAPEAIPVEIVAMAGTENTTTSPWLVPSSASTAPRPAWAPQDPADSLYRAARDALNRDDYARAADLFERIFREHPQSEYAPDAYYWHAFALYRKGTLDDLRAALAALEKQKVLHPEAARRSDTEALATRIRGNLARLGDAEAAETLTKAAVEAEASCDPRDVEVRAAALNALLQMDSHRAVPILKSVLERRDVCSAPLRRKAVFLVSQHVTPETEAVLLDLARNDPDRELRQQAVFWLSRVNTEKAVEALQQILQSLDEPDIQEKAIFALSQHGSEKAARILREYALRADAPARLREKSIFWIGQTGSSADAAFLRDLYARVDEAALKEKIIFSLAQMRDRGNERWLLQVALDSTAGMKLRKHALFWAGQAGAPIDELIDLYDRMPGREMREQLIFVYSQRGEEAAVDKLIDIARNDADPVLRKKAIFWLGQGRSPRAAEALLEIINHE